MNVVDYGKHVGKAWSALKEKVIGPTYPIHVVLEGKPGELDQEPFGAFTEEESTFAIIPATPRVVSYLVSVALLHEGALKEAHREASCFRGDGTDQDAGLWGLGSGQDPLDRDVHPVRADVPCPSP